MASKHWLSLIRPGDWALFLLALLLTGWSYRLLTGGGVAERAVIRQDGKIFAEVGLREPQEILIPGPLGTTRIAIEAGRARVLADPGPRQYCVRQGWLSQPGEIAICAPNRVSLSIHGRINAYDSLAY